MNRELLSGRYDAILSIGQVVPREIAGFASYTKNLVVGCYGGEMINAKSLSERVLRPMPYR